MKKLLLFAATFFSICLLLVGCVSKQTKYADQDFMKSLESGLESRWSFSDANPDDQSKAFYKKLDNKELTALSGYGNKKFKNDDLHEHAISYINALKKQKATLKYYGSDSFIEKWQNATNVRNVELLKINKIHKIEVSEKYKDYLEELKGSGKVEAEKNEDNTKLDTLIKNIKFEAQPKEYPEDDYTTYNAIVENTTSKELKSFSLTIKIIDADNTTADTQYVNTSNWKNGEKVKLTFSTSAAMNRIEINKDYVEFGK